MVRLMAQLVDARFSRIQFTPDLMPSDVLGTSVFNMKTSDFDFYKGPIFADIVLVDEVNRAPAKTQSVPHTAQTGVHRDRAPHDA